MQSCALFGMRENGSDNIVPTNRFFFWHCSLLYTSYEKGVPTIYGAIYINNKDTSALITNKANWDGKPDKTFPQSDSVAAVTDSVAV
jgi:hypothetical protein